MAAAGSGRRETLRFVQPGRDFLPGDDAAQPAIAAAALAEAVAKLIRSNAEELQLCAAGGVDRPVGTARHDLGRERCSIERLYVGSDAPLRSAWPRLIATWVETWQYRPPGWGAPGPSPARRASRGGRRRWLL